MWCHVWRSVECGLGKALGQGSEAGWFLFGAIVARAGASERTIDRGNPLSLPSPLMPEERPAEAVQGPIHFVPPPPLPASSPPAQVVCYGSGAQWQRAAHRPSGHQRLEHSGPRAQALGAVPSRHPKDGEKVVMHTTGAGVRAQ